ncbi:MAG: autotransporter-associated beta strand repeat-containing protein [Chthoniobacteraceae bacterium]
MNPSRHLKKASSLLLSKHALAVFSSSAGLLLITAGETLAASSTWLGTSDGTWATSGNWSNGIPGATTGVTNADIAVFNTSPTQKTITIDANRNIGGITFDTANVGALVIGSTTGNALYLSAGGTIQNTSTVSALETINAPIVLEGNASFLTNVPSSSANGLTFGGSISAASGVNSTLTLGGTNVGANNKITGVISDGSGTVAVTVSNTKWTLSGNNTFSGGLTISTGATVVISGSNSNQGGTILNGGAVLLANNFAFGDSTRSITVTANSTLSNQDGSNAHTIANNISLTSGTLTSNDNATSPLTLSGTLSGAGGLLKSGSGALILTSSNSYSGNTTLQDGYLQIGDDHALGSGTLVIAPPSGKSPTIQSTDSTARTIANALSFTGAGNKIFTFGAAGTGDLTFTNTNSTALPTSGTFQIVNNVSFATSFTGVGAALTKVGTGTMILTGANTYTGTTTVNAGVLKINGSLGNTAVTVNSGATLSGSGSIAGAVTINSGTISGNGLNMGTATLNGASTLSGYNVVSSVIVASGTTSLSGTTKSISTLSVAAGATLNANGTIDGNASVSGLIKGTSTVTGNLALSSGTLAPGNSPGITTVKGNFTTDASSTLVAEVYGTVAGTSYDQVQVSGNVRLAGTLDLSTLSGLTEDTTITIIDNTGSGTTTGYFSTIITSGSTYTVTSNSDYTFTVAGAEYLLSYSSKTDGDGYGNDVTLTVVPEPGAWAMLVGGIGMLSFGQRMRHRGIR